ncbi:hypothetical protein CFter6_2814 [Collimonas fungivorans]|uniref:Uncharacterized protein n=1 Tax=Collimonas fungivorans TaxID=158899 RepID=A0A127PCF6_9BURK|nr:hypothetical protein CFter6_2814 [Collimonas fungivorans]
MMTPARPHFRYDGECRYGNPATQPTPAAQKQQTTYRSGKT